ncbi:enhancer of split mgamma protein-like [Lycorma delicatula]|uniref:enhancer of split mgamma protein-like n=1 Tax=Lycorma delicatula TaxID=130591 RepID=UPI003F50D546
MIHHDNMPAAVEMDQLQPISRTYQYRKVMKPMLERKRRARINRCLDELKELMVTALQAEGENVSKLEKADILELTVRHLHKLRRQQRLAVNPVTDADRFRAGFTHCATEVSRCLASTPGVDVRLGTKLMTHLGHRLNDMDRLSPLSVRVPDTGSSSPAPSSPASVASYTMPLTPSSSASSSPDCDYNHNSSGLLLKVVDMSLKPSKSDPVWRPW